MSWSLVVGSYLRYKTKKLIESPERGQGGSTLSKDIKWFGLAISLGNHNVNMSETSLLRLLDSSWMPQYHWVDKSLAASFLGAKWKERVGITAFILNPAVLNMVLSDLNCTWVIQSVNIMFNPLKNKTPGYCSDRGAVFAWLAKMKEEENLEMSLDFKAVVLTLAHRLS